MQESKGYLLIAKDFGTALYVFMCPHPGRNDQWPAKGGAVAHEIKIRHVGRGDFYGGHIQGGDEVGRSRVEWGYYQLESMLPTVSVDNLIVLRGELALPQKRNKIIKAPLGAVGILEHSCRINSVQSTFLKLDRIRPSCLGRINEGQSLI